MPTRSKNSKNPGINEGTLYKVYSYVGFCWREKTNDAMDMTESAVSEYLCSAQVITSHHRLPGRRVGDKPVSQTIPGASIPYHQC